jgi:hypothetical protein
MLRTRSPNRALGDAWIRGAEICGDAPAAECLAPEDIAPALPEAVAIRRRIAATTLQRCTITRDSNVTRVARFVCCDAHMETHSQPC